ncbi:flagellar biosynthesis protein FlgM, partial [Mesorhizobium sp. M00.F.Ca.ET.149.01.1.1]
DHKVYLDMTFFQQLDQQFGAAGEFARAYVVAHEVGHHVQNLTGIMGKFDQMRQGMSEVDANQLSVRIELQADCFAGVWAHYTQQKGILEQGDIESALNAAKQIGDDTLQKKMQGYVVPESFNHGTSQQRQTWLARGFKSGKLSDCNTMSGPI